MFGFSVKSASLLLINFIIYKYYFINYSGGFFLIFPVFPFLCVFPVCVGAVLFKIINNNFSRPIYFFNFSVLAYEVLRRTISFGSYST